MSNSTSTSQPDLYEALRNLKETCDLTGQEWAELSGVPYGTISRILSGQTPNPGFYAISKMVTAAGVSLDSFYASVYGSAQLPAPSCADVPAAASEPDASVPAYERMIAILNKSIREKNRWIYLLSSSVAILMLFIMFVLIVDLTNPDAGWFRSLFSNGNLDFSTFVPL